MVINSRHHNLAGEAVVLLAIFIGFNFYVLALVWGVSEIESQITAQTNLIRDERQFNEQEYRIKSAEVLSATSDNFFVTQSMPPLAVSPGAGHSLQQAKQYYYIALQAGQRLRKEQLEVFTAATSIDQKLQGLLTTSKLLDVKTKAEMATATALIEAELFQLEAQLAQFEQQVTKLPEEIKFMSELQQGWARQLTSLRALLTASQQLLAATRARDLERSIISMDQHLASVKSVLGAVNNEQLRLLAESVQQEATKLSEITDKYRQHIRTTYRIWQNDLAARPLANFVNSI